MATNNLNILDYVKTGYLRSSNPPFRGTLGPMIIKPVSGKFSDISNRLRAVRAHYGMSSKEFAESADVPPKSYSQWESGDFRISIDGAMKIQSRYGISLDFIYVGRLDTLSNSLATELSSSPLIRQSSASTVMPD